jgi:hypothetical protein
VHPRSTGTTFAKWIFSHGHAPRKCTGNAQSFDELKCSVTDIN